jgi:branched-chain amino acid transport system substrate-binding protein
MLNSKTVYDTIAGLCTHRRQLYRHKRMGNREGKSRRQFLMYAPFVAAATVLSLRSRSAHAASRLKIGHIQSLTGPSAPYGIRARDGARMAVDEINARGGFHDSNGNRYTLEMRVDDMVNDPRQALILFRQYALDPSVVASMGPTNSVGFLPCVPVAGQFELPLIGNGSGAPVREWNPWVYRINPVAQTATPMFLKSAVKAENIKRLAVLYDLTQDAQVGDAKICRTLAEELGYQIIAYEAYRYGDQDFSPQLTKIRARQPDAVYVAASTGDGVRVVIQLREMGIQVPLLTGYGAFFDPVYWDGSRGGIKGCYTWVSQHSDRDSGHIQRWIDSYNRNFDLEATSFSVYGYDAVHTIVECIKRANGSERGALRDVMSDFSFTTPLGNQVTLKNPPHGNNLTPSLSIVKITGRGLTQPVT